ncbi:hypothetical protein ABZ807_22720 [Micromonospora sp. NPDC047548]|uniref:hypothetical protein n=1 Tax=Micromonospora sp. NPDC047548 TaxID=3155624 RepID=UPI00340A8F10
MELRPELCPPVVGPQRIAELCSAIEAIARMLERGESANAAIAGFSAETGHDYAADHFLTYWKSRNIEDFALEAARPATAPALFGSVRFDHGLLDAVDGEDVAAVV